MGRVREALRRADTLRDQHADAVPSACPGPRKDDESIYPQVQEIPFIEVGGSGPPLEASASVLAADPRSVLQIKAMPKEKKEIQVTFWSV